MRGGKKRRGRRRKKVRAEKCSKRSTQEDKEEGMVKGRRGGETNPQRHRVIRERWKKQD